MKVEVMTILLFYEIQVTRSFDQLHTALCVHCPTLSYTVLLYTVTNTEPVSDGVDLTVHVMHTKNRHLHLFQHQPGNAQFIAESHINFGTVYYQNIKVD